MQMPLQRLMHSISVDGIASCSGVSGLSCHGSRWMYELFLGASDFVVDDGYQHGSAAPEAIGQSSESIKDHLSS